MTILNEGEIMKKPKFAHRIQQEDGAEPFADAESAQLAIDGL